MAHARVQESWNHTASLQAQLANMMNDFQKNPKGYSLQDFHPYPSRDKAANDAETEARQRAAMAWLRTVKRIESAPEELIPKIAEEFINRGIRGSD